MDNINVPSYNSLLLNDRQIRALQDLYDYIYRWKLELDDYMQKAAADYKGNHNQVSDLGLHYDSSHAEVEAYLDSSLTADENDYCYIEVPTSDETAAPIDHVDRYEYKHAEWKFSYTLNNSGFSDEEWAAIESGITSSILSKLTDLPDVHDYTSWDSTGTTQAGEGVLGLTGVEDANYYEVIIITNSDGTSDFPQGSLMYIPKTAVFDGETLIPLYDSSKQTVVGYLRIQTERMTSTSEAIEWAMETIAVDVYTKAESDERYAIKDIAIDGPLYIGAGLIIDDVIDDPSNRYDDLTEEITIGCVNDYMWFIWPSSNTLNVEMVMSGFPVPMSVIGTETIDNVEYTVIRSDDTYDFIGTLKIRVVQQTI